MKNEIKNRNYTIDILRLLMAIFIVALHSNLFIEYNVVVSYFPSQVISRLGVPFFALIVGYYFFKSNSAKKYSKILFRYFQTYVLWKAIFYNSIDIEYIWTAKYGYKYADTVDIFSDFLFHDGVWFK